MSDLLKKINEMESRHAAEIKELREVIEKEGVPQDEIILGGMFKVRPDGDGWSLVGEYLMEYQTDRLRAIEKILQTAYKRTPGNIELYDAFKDAEKLGLEF